MTDITSRTLEKIKKCMALSESDNPSEAAAALRQAQKLMAKHNLNATDLRLSDVNQALCRGAVQAKDLPAWVSALRYLIGEVFGVEALNQCYRRRGKYYNYAMFIGIGDKPEAAQYTYEVLFRQLSADRRQFLAELEGPKAARTRKADIFAQGWVQAVRGKVEAVAMSEEDAETLNRWKEKTYGDQLEASKIREHNINVRDLGAIQAGADAGRSAQLFRGVGAKEADKQVCS